MHTSNTYEDLTGLVFMRLLDKRLARLIILGLVWSGIYLTTLSRPSLFDDADTVHAEAVREMVETGDWVTLHINNGIRYLEKAPLMYWASAICVKAFGLSEWTIRLPLAIFTLLLTLLIFAFGKRFWGEDSGFYASLIYVSSLGPFAFTRIFLPDVMLAFFMTLAFYFYLRVADDSEKASKLFGMLDWRSMMIFASCAMAVLTKGLVGAAFIGLVILAHIVLTGKWEILKRLQIIQGILVFLIIAAPWHLAAGFANKGFFWFYFVNEHFLRYLGLRYPKDYDTVPLWLFWTLHLAWLFPWTAFIWGAVRRFPTSLPRSRADVIHVFPYVWILLILFFFSFSTTQEYYTFPTLPAFALILGQVIAMVDSSQGERYHRSARIGLGVFAFVGLILGATLLLLIYFGHGYNGAGDLSGTLTVNPDQYALSFGHMHDLTPATFARLSKLVYIAAAIFILFPLASFGAALFGRWRISYLCMALMMAGFLHCYQAGMVEFEPILSSRSLADAIMSHYRPEDRIVVNAVYEKGSSINYYSHIQLSILNGRNGNLWYGSYFPDAPQIFFDDDAFLKAWKTKDRIFLFSEGKPLRDFLARHPDFDYRELAASGGKKVLVNW